MEEYYSIFKTIHVVSIIIWIGSMLFMPILFYFHIRNINSSFNKNDRKALDEVSKILSVIERILLKFAMNPAMFSTYFFGLSMAHIYGFESLDLWFYIKMMFVLLITAIHGLFAKITRELSLYQANESLHIYSMFFGSLVFLFAFLAIFMVIVQPFE